MREFVFPSLKEMTVTNFNNLRYLWGTLLLLFDEEYLVWKIAAMVFLFAVSHLWQANNDFEKVYNKKDNVLDTHCLDYTTLSGKSIAIITAFSIAFTIFCVKNIIL